MSSSPTPIQTAPAPVLTVTERAIEKVKYFAGQMPEAAGKPLRIFIQGGGCSGFQYGFTFDEQRADDSVIGAGDVKVVVDPQSAIYLKGSTVDYIEDFRGSGFSVENPNATGSCGCGKSFQA
jgi:iron-sulfur cluster insertion protein